MNFHQIQEIYRVETGSNMVEDSNFNNTLVKEVEDAEDVEMVNDVNDLNGFTVEEKDIDMKNLNDEGNFGNFANFDTFPETYDHMCFDLEVNQDEDGLSLRRR